jgi:hypothetical protein
VRCGPSSGSRSGRATPTSRRRWPTELRQEGFEAGQATDLRRPAARPTSSVA